MTTKQKFNISDAVANTDAEETSGDSLKRAIKMGEQMASAFREVERCEAALKEAQEAYNKYRLGDLPELLKELKLDMIRLEDGTEIEVDAEIKCSITKAVADQAYAWLRQNNFGGLIKTNVSVDFGKEEKDKADKLAAQLGKKFENVVEKETVHPATLKSFVKEQLEAGALSASELKLFSVYQYSVAKLKLPKEVNHGRK